MRIESKAYGPIEISERQVIAFPVGIFGFESLHEYALLDATESGFYWLQSLSDSRIAFVLINPYLFRHDYVLNIPDGDLEEIGSPVETSIRSRAVVSARNL